MSGLIRAQVSHVSSPCRDVRYIELSARGGLPPYGPGDHIDCHIEAGGRSLRRSYSLVGKWLGDGRYRIAVRLVPDSRGGSACMATLKPGDTLSITPPRPHFPLSRLRSVHRVFLAGGIGITPLIGMIEAVMDDDAPFDLYYAGRSAASMPFLDELAQRLGPRLHASFDDLGQRPDLAGLVRALPHDAELYVCGPIGLLNAARQVWRDSGRDPVNLRFETFAAGGVAANSAFQVSIPRLGRELRVNEDESLLEALERAGLEPLSNCRKGECGLCAVEVLQLEGAIDHRDVFFSESQKAQNKLLCSCVSRLEGGRAVIDFP